MSLTLATFFNKLSTDTSFLQRFKNGQTNAEREDLMESMGLSNDDKNVVRGHDIVAAEEALREELKLHLDAWADTDKCIISVSAVSAKAIISAPHVTGRAIISAQAIISAPHVTGRAIISAPRVPMR